MIRSHAERSKNYHLFNPLVTCHRPIRITPVQCCYKKGPFRGDHISFWKCTCLSTLNTHPRLTSNLLIRKVFSEVYKFVELSSGEAGHCGRTDRQTYSLLTKTCYTAVHTVRISTSRLHGPKYTFLICRRRISNQVCGMQNDVLWLISIFL